jgi:protein-L-isoaspartate(D-aspartate) O-methyltransferase
VTTSDENESFALARQRMVERDLRGEGIRDERVLKAMGAVPRHEFVPAALRAEAYADRPLPIGEGQTISQPFVVALMSEKLALRGGERVLEIGTGSGYQAAVLAELGCQVYSIEILPELAETARLRLEHLGYKVHVRAGDGFFGWPEAAPFDAIIITAAAPEVPQSLVQQLKDGGRIILPLGRGDGQALVLGTKEASGVKLQTLGGVAFVPMTGEVRRK